MQPLYHMLEIVDECVELGEIAVLGTPDIRGDAQRKLLRRVKALKGLLTDVDTALNEVEHNDDPFLQGLFLDAAHAIPRIGGLIRSLESAVRARPLRAPALIDELQVELDSLDDLMSHL